jgi:inosine-uridine nucleoside N-ribohydrolase
VRRPDHGRSEQRNYDEILHIVQLSRRSGLLKHRKENQIPQAFRGAKQPLELPASGNWLDTQPIVCEASEAILAAARGASPDNPVWVLPVGPCSNIASAILLAREEGLDLKSRIKICWLGGTQERVTNNFNGNNDPWSVYVTGQSGVEFWIIPARPTGVSLLFDKRFESDLYPDNPLGEYLEEITPAMAKALLDLTAISMVISDHVAKLQTEAEISRPAPLPWHGRHWLKYVVHSEILGPDQKYRFREVEGVRFRARVQGEWQLVDSPTNVRIIHDVDEEAMKADFFNALNGKPTALPPKREN